MIIPVTKAVVIHGEINSELPGICNISHIVDTEPIELKNHESNKVKCTKVITSVSNFGEPYDYIVLEEKSSFDKRVLARSDKMLPRVAKKRKGNR